MHRRSLNRGGRGRFHGQLRGDDQGLLLADDEEGDDLTVLLNRLQPAVCTGNLNSLLRRWPEGRNRAGSISSGKITRSSASCQLCSHRSPSCRVSTAREAGSPRAGSSSRVIVELPHNPDLRVQEPDLQT